MAPIDQETRSRAATARIRAYWAPSADLVIARFLGRPAYPEGPSWDGKPKALDLVSGKGTAA